MQQLLIPTYFSLVKKLNYIYTIVTKIMDSINIALLSAMPEEIGSPIENLENVTLSEYGDLKIYYGKLYKNSDGNWRK